MLHWDTPMSASQSNQRWSSASPPIPIGRPPTIAVVRLSVLYSLLSLPIALNWPGLRRLQSDLHTNDNSVPLFIHGAVTGLLQRCPSITLVCSCTCSVGIIVIYGERMIEIHAEELMNVSFANVKQTQSKTIASISGIKSWSGIFSCKLIFEDHRHNRK